MNGYLLINKHQGITSNGILKAVKRLLDVKNQPHKTKIGHAGCLDPLATGMLVVCLGRGTKFAQYFLDAPKEYVVTARLGITTDTQDSEGQVILKRTVPPLSSEQFLDVLTRFKGRLLQIPPMFSALKHKGKPLYQLARKGQEVERPPREIEIHSLKINSFEGDLFQVTTLVSKGTYIRTLVHDIGEALGCGAHMVALHRSRVGEFEENEMARVDDLKDEWQKKLIPVEAPFHNWPKMKLKESVARDLRDGKPISVNEVEGEFDSPAEKGYAMHRKLEGGVEEFLGLGYLAEGGIIKAHKWV